MPELLTRYDWLKFFIRVAAVGLIALGTAASDFIQHHPTAAIVCAAVGLYTKGYFTDPVKAISPTKELEKMNE